MNFTAIVFVFLGGGIGSVIRFLISFLVNSQNKISLPWATFLSNLSSIFILLLAYYLSGVKSTVSETTRYLILIGFCGGLSTFSTFSFETAELFRKGEFLIAMSNIIFNNLFCIAFVILYFKRVNG